MTLLTVAGGGVVILFGMLWISSPQLVFYIRNWPGVSTDMEMNQAGELMYRVFGVLQVIAGIAMIFFSFVE